MMNSAAPSFKLLFFPIDVSSIEKIMVMAIIKYFVNKVVESWDAKPHQ